MGGDLTGWPSIDGGGRGPVILINCINLIGIQCPFRSLIASGVAEAGSMRNSCTALRAVLSPKPTIASQKIAGLRTRDSALAPATSSKSPFDSLTVRPALTMRNRGRQFRDMRTCPSPFSLHEVFHFQSSRAMVLQLICFVTGRFNDMRSPTAAAATTVTTTNAHPQKRAKSKMKVFATISSGRPASWR